MKQTIFVEDLVVPTIIGFYSNEREETRNIILNIRIGLEESVQTKDDDLNDTLDYCKVIGDVLVLGKESSFYILETFGHHVIEMYKNYPGVNYIRVKLDKRYLKTEAKRVGVELERTNE